MDGVYALCRNRSGALVVERLSPGWSVVVGVCMCVCVCFIYPHRGGRKENPLIIREAPKFLYPCHPCSHLPASASRKGEPSSQRPLLQRHNCHHTPAAATQTTLIPSPHHQSLHSPRRRSPDHARHFPLPLHSRTTPTNAGHQYAHLALERASRLYGNGLLSPGPSRCHQAAAHREVWWHGLAIEPTVAEEPVRLLNLSSTNSAQCVDQRDQSLKLPESESAATARGPHTCTCVT